MKTYDQIRAVTDNHAQMRQNSCSQSAVEMVLKLYGILERDEYPDQAMATWDGTGFEHYHGLGKRRYKGIDVLFKEEKFDTNLREDWRKEAWEMGIDLMVREIYPIYSFAKPGGGFHCHVGIPDAADTMQFITKTDLGISEAKIESRQASWRLQTKTEILIVRPA